MRVEQTGYGAGSRDYPRFPNALRVIIGETEDASNEADSSDADFQDERLVMIETNIDDMSPQNFGYLLERALEMGALDCFFTPVQMKKNRPGVLVSILCRQAERESISDLLFTETTTLGVREFEVRRRALRRETVRVETPYGEIDVKVARLRGRIINEMPEYEQCARAARVGNVPLKTVEEAARAALAKMKGRES